MSRAQWSTSVVLKISLSSDCHQSKWDNDLCYICKIQVMHRLMDSVSSGHSYPFSIPRKLFQLLLCPWSSVEAPAQSIEGSIRTTLSSLYCLCTGGEGGHFSWWPGICSSEEYLNAALGSGVSSLWTLRYKDHLIIHKIHTWEQCN